MQITGTVREGESLTPTSSSSTGGTGDQPTEGAMEARAGGTIEYDTIYFCGN